MNKRFAKLESRTLLDLSPDSIGSISNFFVHSSDFFSVEFTLNTSIKNGVPSKVSYFVRRIIVTSIEKKNMGRKSVQDFEKLAKIVKEYLPKVLSCKLFDFTRRVSVGPKFGSPSTTLTSNFLRSLPSTLKCLWIHSSSFDGSCLEKFSSLKEFRCGGAPLGQYRKPLGLYDDGMKTLTSLRQLRVGNQIRMTANGLRNVFAEGNLERLYMRINPRVKFSDFNSGDASLLENIRRVSLRVMDLGGKHFTIFLSFLPSLWRLTLDSCWGQEKDNFKYVNVERLQILRLGYSGERKNEEANIWNNASISHLGNLVKLGISECPYMTGHVLSNFLKLKILKLGGCVKLSEGNFDKLGQLEVLEIRGGKHIIDDRMLSKLKSLKSFSMNDVQGVRLSRMYLVKMESLQELSIGNVHSDCVNEEMFETLNKRTSPVFVFVCCTKLMGVDYKVDLKLIECVDCCSKMYYCQDCLIECVKCKQEVCRKCLEICYQCNSELCVGCAASPQHVCKPDSSSSSSGEE